MKILYVHKAKFNRRPPVISTVLLLCELGYEVDLVTCGISDEYKEKLEKYGVKIHIFPRDEHSNKSNIVNKLLEYYRFKREVAALLRHEYSIADTVLWIEGNYTLVSLGKIIKKYRYILQIQELNNEHKVQFRAISKVIRDAQCVFVPEYCRAVLLQNWFHLSQRPTVLENKPYFLPTLEQLKFLAEKYKDKIRLLEGKRNIIFQGGISSERKLCTFISAIKKLGEPYQLILLGKDQGMLSVYQQINPQLIHIDHIDAPDYLLITSLCHIGIVSYDPLTLNSAFCAPNKIFEYSAYSLPMIGNDIPGLRFKFERYKLGVIVNEDDEYSIINAIKEIECNYEQYRQNAGKLYKFVDNRSILDSEVKKVIG